MKKLSIKKLSVKSFVTSNHKSIAGDTVAGGTGYTIHRTKECGTCYTNPCCKTLTATEKDTGNCCIKG